MGNIEIEQNALKLLNEGIPLNEVEKITGYELIPFKDNFENKYIRVNLWKILKNN